MRNCTGILETVTPELVQIAQETLPREYIDGLREKPSFAESLVARFILFMDLWYLPEFDETGKPVFQKNEFWSFSHKPGFVYIGYSENGERVGVDLEILTPRDISVMDIHTSEEYKYFGEKNWEHFYLLWTLKESVVKCFWYGLDNFWDIHIEHISEKYTMYTIADAVWNEDLTEYIPEWWEKPNWGDFFKYKRNIIGTFRWKSWKAECSVQKNHLVYSETREI